MRICIDLDGVISKLKQVNEDYSNLEPVDDAIQTLKKLKQDGHYLIIYTARHMKTCNGNVGLVNAKIAKKTLDWLERHNIEFDEIHFNKPFADLYIDDNAIRFTKWSDMDLDGLPVSRETEFRKP